MYSPQLELECKSVLLGAQRWPDFPLLPVHIPPRRGISSRAMPSCSPGAVGSEQVTHGCTTTASDAGDTRTHTRDKLLREAVRDCEVSSCTQERPCSAPAVSRRYKTHVMGQLPSEICTEQSSRSNVKNQIPESLWNQTIQCNEAAPFPSPFFSPCALKRKGKQKENSVCISLVLLLPLYCTVAACVSHLAACQSRAQVCCRKYYSQVGLLSL